MVTNEENSKTPDLNPVFSLSNINDSEISNVDFQEKVIKILNKQLTDDVVNLEKQVAAQNAIIDRYKVLLSESKPNLFKRTMKRCRRKDGNGKAGGARAWEDWVVLMVCELLVLGVPPKSTTEPKT